MSDAGAARPSWERRLPGVAREILHAAGAALPAGASLYVVGGTVRDGLRDAPSADLDLALEGGAAGGLLRALQAALGGELVQHEAFGTASLTLPHGPLVDVVETRRERYPAAGALPRVVPGSLLDDLRRRDFAANAVAVRWWPSPVRTIDPLAGRRDVAHGWLRVLHSASFRDDPTRIVRGARLAGRLGWRWAPGTAAAASAARRWLDAVSADRWRAELERAFAEPRVTPVLDALDAADVLRDGFGLALERDALTALDAARASGHEVSPRAYLLAALWPLAPAARQRAVTRFGWPRRPLEVLARLERVRADPSAPLTAEALGPEGRAFAEVLGGVAARAAQDAFEAEGARKVRGSDVLGLGLPPGPAVGDVLAEVRRARREGRVHGFDDERALARELVERRLATTERRNDAS